MGGADMRVWVYARTSGDEKKTDQDVKAQAAAVAHLAGLRSWEVVGESCDDGVTGDTDPVGRRGFARAVQAVKGGLADAVVVSEVSRFSRQHPVLALMAWDQVAGDGVPVVSLKEGHFDGLDLVEGDKEGVLLRFITFWTSWGERLTIKERTQMAMLEIKEGRRKTKSGKPPGRPCKITRADAVQAFAWMQAEGLTVAGAARRLSEKRGAFAALDERTRKKHRVGRTTLLGALERYNVCVENPEGSEKVNDQEGESCGMDGPDIDTRGPDA